MVKSEHVRDYIAFWIFGLANNFAYSVFLSGAEDIMSREQNRDGNSSSKLETECQTKIVSNRNCDVQSLGLVLLADIIPSLIIKMIYPCFINRVPMTARHVIVVMLQVSAFLIAAFSTSITMSLVGVVMASAGSGLGESCYLGLTSYYSRHTIGAWSSGTGGAGLSASLVYAGLTEPHLANLSPKTTLLIMLVVPVIFFLTYFLILTPANDLYRAKLSDARTWIIPKSAVNRIASSSAAPSSSIVSDSPPGTPLKKHRLSDDSTTSLDGGSGGSKTERVPSVNPSTYGEMWKATVPLLKYMIPLTIVYAMEYLINQGITPLLVFECSRGFNLSLASTYRWYQVLYQLGVFISRTSVNFIQFPLWVLILLAGLQTMNLVFFAFDAIFRFVPHICIFFGLILIEGLFGGSAYANTFHAIHEEVDPASREFSLGIATLADSVGIVIAGFAAIPVHNGLCSIIQKAHV